MPDRGDLDDARRIERPGSVKRREIKKRWNECGRHRIPLKLDEKRKERISKGEVAKVVGLKPNVEAVCGHSGWNSRHSSVID